MSVDAAALQVATKHASERLKENDALETGFLRVTAGFMKTYTYSTARQRLAEVLEETSREGEVQIRRQDGRVYAVTPAAEPAHSPFANVTGRAVKGATSTALFRTVREEGWARVARRGARDGQVEQSANGRQASWPEVLDRADFIPWSADDA